MTTNVQLGSLCRADGSAQFEADGYTVIAGVNGPIEVQRRDELAEEATLEVNVRPSIGLAGVRERHFESLIHKTLQQIVKLQMFPRTLIQVTLQVIKTPEDEHANGRPPQAASNLAVLPPLLNAAVVALLSTSIPLRSTFAASMVVVMPDGSIFSRPNPRAANGAESIHVFVFTSSGKLLLVESEGSFNMAQWQEVAKVARAACSGSTTPGESKSHGNAMRDAAPSLDHVVHKAVRDKLARDNKWREAP